MANERLGICVNLTNFAHTQYQGFDFTSMCKFADRYIGANDSGLHVLFEDSLDDGVEINAFFELVKTDFGVSNPKHLRRVYVGFSATGNLQISFTVDGDESTRTFYLQQVDDDDVMGGNVAPIGRDVEGRYWTIRVDNVNGCDFTIDRIQASMYVRPLSVRNRKKDLVIVEGDVDLPSFTVSATATVS